MLIIIPRKGNFKENKMQGKGILTWKDGKKYDGNFVDG